MIFSNLETYQSSKMVFPYALRRAIDFLVNSNLSTMKPGNYPIDGNKIYAQIVETNTKELSATFPEIHNDFIDIHFTISGEEQIGYALMSEKNIIHEDNLAEKDIAFYESAEGEQFVKLGQNRFTVVFPWDIHRPCCAVNEPMAIKKAILKINKNML